MKTLIFLALVSLFGIMNVIAAPQGQPVNRFYNGNQNSTSGELIDRSQQQQVRTVTATSTTSGTSTMTNTGTSTILLPPGQARR